MYANDNRLIELVHQFIEITVGNIYPVEVYKGSVGWENKSKFPWFVSHDGDDEYLEINESLIKMIQSTFGIDKVTFVDKIIIEWFNKKQDRIQINSENVHVYPFNVY